MSFISKIFRKRNAADVESYDVLGSSAVCEAAREGNKLEVMNLVNRGVDVNATGGGTLDFSPLMWAAEEGNVEMMNVLLDNGANPNLINRRGMCALLLAAKNGHIDAVKLLLNRGASVQCETQGVTPLHAAAAYGHTEAVRLLLEKGARDDKGLAFQSAAEIKNEDIMNLLSQLT
jgi:ankyrin repeat protein